MLIKFDPGGGDLGRGITVLPEELSHIFELTSSIFKYLPNDYWACGFEVSNPEENLVETIKILANEKNVLLYEVDKRVLFEIRDKDNHSLCKSIFYVIKVRE